MDLFKINYDLFSKSLKPLAHRIRPSCLLNFIGQEHILSKGSVLNNMIENNKFQSMIFYGPPGTGKTTLANIISNNTNNFFAKISALTSGIKEVRDIIMLAKDNLAMYNKRTILFIDEIHRFNKTQQDFLLEYIENGDIVFIGATTENPAYEVNNALLSRVIVFEFKPLSFDNLKNIVNNAILNDEVLKNQNIKFNDASLKYLIQISSGDARNVLNNLELISQNILKNNNIITTELLKDIFDKAKIYYDKDKDDHYNLISAFIKSMRIGDSNAVIYYLAALLSSGEDINFIARRMIIFASEDVGNANPNAIIIANSCAEAVKKIGMPEARIILSQCALYLTNSSKSNSAYLAINKALEHIKINGIAEIPKFLKITKSICEEKKEYKYPHNYEKMKTDQQYKPDEIIGINFYIPKDVGYESQFIKNSKED